MNILDMKHLELNKNFLFFCERGWKLSDSVEMFRQGCRNFYISAQINVSHKKIAKELVIDSVCSCVKWNFLCFRSTKFKKVVRTAFNVYSWPALKTIEEIYELVFHLGMWVIKLCIFGKNKQGVLSNCIRHDQKEVMGEKILKRGDNWFRPLIKFLFGF